MPAGAMVWVMAGDDRAWPPEAHLAAVAADSLRAGNWQRGGGKGERPKPLPRPAEIIQQVRTGEAHAARARRFLQRQRERGGGAG